MQHQEMIVPTNLGLISRISLIATVFMVIGLSMIAGF
jgi:hypothetical protein